MGSSNCICTEKINKIRICADYSTGLNDYLKEINYPRPAVEEIFANLHGGRIFSKLDLSGAYLQISVEEKCAELLNINRHIIHFQHATAYWCMENAWSYPQLKQRKAWKISIPGTREWVEWRLSCEVTYTGRVWIKTLKTWWNCAKAVQKHENFKKYISWNLVENYKFLWHPRSPLFASFHYLFYLLKETEKNQIDVNLF